MNYCKMNSNLQQQNACARKDPSSGIRTNTRPVQNKCSCSAMPVQNGGRCNSCPTPVQDGCKGENCCPLLDSHSTCPAVGMFPSQKQNCREIPDKNYLLKEINECSFAVNDMLLYLDSHPCDEAALAFFQEHRERRVDALKEYAKYYGPLTIDTADDEASRSFAWVETPWPWEGGDC